MRRLARPSAILPLAIVAVAAGVAFNVPGAASAADSQSQQAAGPAAGADGGGVSVATSVPGKIVGSGDENLYSVDHSGLPEVSNPGQYLYQQGCSTCHGQNGEGSKEAPSLIGVGAAAVDFYISSGRMPLNQPVVQAPRKKALYNEVQRHAIADYVASLAPGPAIPKVDTSKGNLVEGNEIYANNCAACHNSAGSGGALGKDYYAPRLDSATPLQVAEAVRIGPGGMPVFGPDTLSDQQVNSLVKYVEHLKHADHPGGFSLGRLGPFSEGFFAWMVGLGALLGISRWIGEKV